MFFPASASPSSQALKKRAYEETTARTAGHSDIVDLAEGPCHTEQAHTATHVSFACRRLRSHCTFSMSYLVITLHPRMYWHGTRSVLLSVSRTPLKSIALCLSFLPSTSFRLFRTLFRRIMAHTFSPGRLATYILLVRVFSNRTSRRQFSTFISGLSLSYSWL